MFECKCCHVLSIGEGDGTKGYCTACVTDSLSICSECGETFDEELESIGEEEQLCIACIEKRYGKTSLS